MGLESLVEWTKSKLSRFTGADVRVTNADTFDGLTSGRVAAPALDLFENATEFRLVVDAPGATPRNTHVTWNEIDTLAVHVRREAASPGSAWFSEYEESDWYREITLPPEVDGTKVTATVQDGVVTIRLTKRRTTGSRLVPVLAG